ncbi:DUF488 domain-containing protein [Alkalihalobacillus sp. AL-G]|uniref:DUF488 domain-containing protein n=1 Tax=Alkalihalobacillus sp. AL-G TaxID=2926399 RepID=UPI00272B13F9|nr:DUF488 domain-containing protein [Alkalihalobacillus sp. AL-G]WLD93273.1 DUF488 domain-containing protein [Alkalihalobacillus sp. AL-G]
MAITLKRIYQTDGKKDGKRILVDRVWPRGVSKEEANLDVWLKEVAPSPDLRKWFGHDPEKFGSFKEKYNKELDNDQEKSDAFQKLKELAKNEDLILLYGAKDEEHNHAIVLKELLD